MKTRLLVLFFLLAGQWGLASPVKLPFPEVETLPNGMRIAWFLDDKLPVVDLSVMVHAGYRDDPKGKSGTAELLLASVGRSASGMTAQGIAKAIEKTGGTRYSNINDDVFNFGVHGLAPDADTLLELLGKIITQAEFPQTEVDRERSRLLDRWNHIEDYSEMLLTLAYHRMNAAGTSYGRGSILSSQELKKVTRADVLQFYQNFFIPKNSILTVIGRVNREAFRQKILATFGHWTAKNELRRNWLSFTDSRILSAKDGRVKNRQSILVIDRPQLAQAQIRIGSQAPRVNSPDHYALEIANAILGELFNSRLNTLVRDKFGLTYAISSAFSYSKDFAEFTVSTTTQNETAGQLIYKVMGVLKDFQRSPVQDDEVQTAKKYLIGGFPLMNTTLGAVAGRWLTGVVFDLPSDYLNEFGSKIDQVSLAQVAAATKKCFDLDRLSIVIAGDAKKIRKSLQSAGFQTIQQITLSDLK